ncbi:hypothetical protein ES703_10424 [subsurface metagenome]
MVMTRTFSTNRLIFYALLVTFALVVYLYERFKPEGGESPEFRYHPGTGEDLPDIPLEVTLLGGSGYRIALELREPEDLERYQEFVRVMRDGEPLTERKEEMMRRPGYPFYPNRKSLLTPKLLAISFIAFVVACIIISTL